MNNRIKNKETEQLLTRKKVNVFQDKTYKLFVIFGLTCSGKSTLIDLLEHQKEFVVYDWGNVFKPYIPNVSLKREDITKQIKNIIKERGRFFFVDKVIESVTNQVRIDTKNIVVCGARHPLEIAYLFSRFQFYELIYIHSDTELRFNRSLLRSREGDAKSFEEFIFHDVCELKEGILDIMYDFHYFTIVNNSTKRDYENKIIEKFNVIT